MQYSWKLFQANQLFFSAKVCKGPKGSIYDCVNAKEIV